MRIEGLLMMLSCAAVLAVPAGAQTDSTAEPGKKGHQFSPALQKKVAERDGSAALSERRRAGWTVVRATSRRIGP